ncbi:hypothetical protein C5Y96_09325 [Blastopirellula marina]|uniref:Uncharacterized protein n=1 Tax=Blastopirellula marina TaxID=124 RepID=A0A2S8FUI0_9BACT|nr:hypothetical protein C5Y96_09325 [Blastopirellula marina]RCS53413.1 hypothetical protein DTL36_09335 [Bremerella cremea]
MENPSTKANVQSSAHRMTSSPSVEEKKVCRCSDSLRKCDRQGKGFVAADKIEETLDPSRTDSHTTRRTAFHPLREFFCMIPDDEDHSAPARFGRWINQLDIDFSSFTPVGWVVALGSLLLGGFAAYFAYIVVSDWANGQGFDAGKAGGLSFCITMIVVTVFSFQGLRAIARWTGNPVVKERED